MSGEFDARFQAFQALPREQKAEKIQMLSDDQKQAFVKSYNDWKVSSPGTQSSPVKQPMGPEYNPQKLQISRQLTDAQYRARANDITKGEFWNALVQKGSMGIAPKITDKVSNFINGTPNATNYQDQYKKDADASTGGSIAGRILNPTNLIPAGGAVGNALLAGSQDAVQDAVGGRKVDVGQAATDAAMAGGMSKAIDIGVSPVKAYNAAIEYLGPKSMDMMHEMAAGMLKARGMDPQAMTKYMNSPSEMGLARRFDDFIYTLINKIQPKAFESGLSRASRTADIVNESGREVAASRQKMNDTQIQAPELSNDLQSQARRLQLNPGKYGSFGPQAAQVVRQEYNKVPTMISQAMRPTSFVMGQPTSVIPKANIGQAAKLPVFDQVQSKILGPDGKPVPMGKIQPIGQDLFAFDQTTNSVTPTQAFQVGPEIESTKIPFDQLNAKRQALAGAQFKPAYNMSHPQKAVQLAGQAIQNYGMSKAGYTPEQRIRLQKAKSDYSTKAHTQQLLANAEHHGAGGISPLTPGGQARSGVATWLKNRATSIGFVGAQKTAQYAMRKLDARLQTGQYNDMSPFEADLLRSKLQKISEMEPKQAALYSFAESMRDPTFRAILAKAQEDTDNEPK